MVSTRSLLALADWRDNLGLSADLLQILLSIPAFVVLFYIIRRWILYRWYLKKLETKIAAGNHVAIIVSTNPRNQIADEEVLAFLKGVGVELDAPPHRIDHGEVKRSDLRRLIPRLHNIKLEISRRGAEQVHLFLNCPLALAVKIGAELDNWIPVRVYQHSGGAYEFWALVGKGLFSDYEASALKDIAEEAAGGQP
jgi:hypothetical protein